MYLHLYEITCKHVYEIRNTQRLVFFERTQKFQKKLKKIKKFVSLSIS
jgi:hypothetical protein